MKIIDYFYDLVRGVFAYEVYVYEYDTFEDNEFDMENHIVDYKEFHLPILKWFTDRKYYKKFLKLTKIRARLWARMVISDKWKEPENFSYPTKPEEL